MDQLAYVEPGKWPTSEHLRVFEAYGRDHIPGWTGGYFDEETQNRAVDWWNAGCPGAAPMITRVPDASELRGQIAVMINVATSEPGHRMSLPMVALGNEIWHTIVAFLYEHHVHLGTPEQVDQSLRWSRDTGADPRPEEV